jgi:hypothetical protein
MKCWFGRLLTLTSLFFVATAARADTIQWSYAWTRSPLSVPSDANGTGGISLTLGQGLPMTGSSDITAVNLSTFSSAPVGTTDHFTNSPFTLGLTVKDTASGKSATTSFMGVFNGSLTPNSSSITATYDHTVHQLTLGSNLYSIQLTSYVAPGIPDSTAVGSIGAHVSVTLATVDGGNHGGGNTSGGGGSVGVSDAPEPTSLLLAGLASPALCLACWRRVRATRACARVG